WLCCLPSSSPAQRSFPSVRTPAPATATRSTCPAATGRAPHADVSSPLGVFPSVKVPPDTGSSPTNGKRPAGVSGRGENLVEALRPPLLRRRRREAAFEAVARQGVGVPRVQPGGREGLQE